VKIIITVEAHAHDREGAISAAIREVAHIYPMVSFQPTGEPRPTQAHVTISVRP
jgi:hypothetical protein